MIVKSKSETGIDVLTHLFAFISILLIGADKWGVNVGVNLRLDQIFLVIVAILIFMKSDFIVYKNISLIGFVFFTLLSVVFAFDPIRSMLYYFSIVYNVFFVFLTFANYVKIYGIERFISIFRKTCYVQFFVLAIQFLLKVFFDFEFSFLPGYGQYLGIYRFSLWFYEPSYLATYLVFWLTLSLSMSLIGKDLTYIADIILCLIMLVISTSSSGFLGICLSLFIVYLFWVFRGITKWKLLFLLIPITLFLVFRFRFPSIYNTFVSRIFAGDLNASSGGRVEQWTETWNVFKDNACFGIGPGNYGAYLNKENTYVPSNVTLELLATTGIFSTICYVALNISLIVRPIKDYCKNRHDKKKIITMSLGISLLVFVVILQINQGYLRLYHWMFMGVIFGLLKSSQTNLAKNKIMK